MFIKLIRQTVRDIVYTLMLILLVGIFAEWFAHGGTWNGLFTAVCKHWEHAQPHPISKAVWTVR